MDYGLYAASPGQRKGIPGDFAALSHVPVPVPVPVPARRVPPRSRTLIRPRGRTAKDYRHAASAAAPGSWQTKHGREFRRIAEAQLAAKPGRCGLKPPPIPAPPWQTTQSRST